MKNVRESLVNFGLNENEAQVYLAALRTGDCSVGGLQRETSLHRQIIYNAADSLMKRGLLSVKRQGGRKRFTAASPSTFMELYEAGRTSTMNLVRELEVAKSTAGFAGDAKIYQGKAEIRRYYLESIAYQPIRSQVRILGIESKRYFKIFEEDPNAYQKLENVRIARKVKWQLLLFGDRDDEALLNNDRPHVSCRILRNELLAPFDIVVWRDHVGILIYGQDPMVLDIPGEVVAQGFRKYLSLLWEQGIEV